MSYDTNEPQSIRLVSNCICYGPAPKDSDEVEQNLTVSSSGRVWFSARNYAQYIEGKGLCRKRQLNIGEWKARFLISLVSNIYRVDDVTDCGSWELTVRESEGKRQISGPLIGDVDGHFSAPVTKILRRYIPIYGLWGFDSEMSPDYEGKKAIYLFADRWVKKLSEKPDEHDFELSFGNDCIKLGFQMDCGNEFNKRYPGCLNAHDEKLELVIDEIVDVDLLGSAVFSYWRYLTHWAGPYQLEGEVCKWFLLALKRMRTITR